MGHIPGLTAKSMLPSLVTGADVFLGSIEFSFLTEVDSQGEVVNTGKNVSASFIANVAPTGSAKTYLMILGPVGLGAAQRVRVASAGRGGEGRSDCVV